MIFFELLLEFHEFDLGMALVLLGRSLVGEVAFFQERAVGIAALVAHCIIALQQLRQIRNGPELPISYAGISSEQLGRGIPMQLVLHGFDLLGFQSGAISPEAMVDQGGEAPICIGTYPVHQTASRTAADIEDLFDPVPRPIQANGLKSDLGVGFLTV